MADLTVSSVLASLFSFLRTGWVFVDPTHPSCSMAAGRSSSHIGHPSGLTLKEFLFDQFDRRLLVVEAGENENDFKTNDHPGFSPSKGSNSDLAWRFELVSTLIEIILNINDEFISENSNEMFIYNQ